MQGILSHVGIIMDGNRRWAQDRGLAHWQGHEAGARVVEQLPVWCKDFGITELTLYAFSTENFKRKRDEVDYLMRIFKQQFEGLLARDVIEYRINFVGRIEMFSQDVVLLMRGLVEKTKNVAGYKVNFAMAYDGRAEIVDAVRAIAGLVKESKIAPETIDERVIENHLYLRSRPDLIIRTSGEQRTSGFLLWQGSYAEFYFCPKDWPDFSKTDLGDAIKDYSARQRRFGK